MELTNAAYDYRRLVVDGSRDLALQRDVAETLTLLLAAIAGVSLVVGGISVWVTTARTASANLALGSLLLWVPRRPGAEAAQCVYPEMKKAAE